MTRPGEPVRGPALLFCPGDRPDRFARAAAAADTVVLDLEDAVAPADKPRARAEVAAALPHLDPARTVVRVNAVGTPWHADDLAALAPVPDLVVMLPMAADPADLAAVAPRPVLALCETAAGVLAAPGLAAAANCVGLMWGSEDLAADLGARPGRSPAGSYPPVLEEARTRVLYAARAAGVVPVDTVLVDLADLELLRADSGTAAAAGFAAKACIHPSQVPVVRAAFRPTDDELRGARELLAAAADAPAVFTFRGRMVDAPVVRRAGDVLRRAGDHPHR